MRDPYQARNRPACKGLECERLFCIVNVFVGMFTFVLEDLYVRLLLISCSYLKHAMTFLNVFCGPDYVGSFCV